MPKFTINADVSIVKGLSKHYLIKTPECIVNPYYRCDKYGKVIDRATLIYIILNTRSFAKWIEENSGPALFRGYITTRGTRELGLIIKECVKELSDYESIKKKIDTSVEKDREIRRIRRRENSIVLAKREIERLKKALAKAKKMASAE